MLSGDLSMTVSLPEIAAALPKWMPLLSAEEDLSVFSLSQRLSHHAHAHAHAHTDSASAHSHADHVTLKQFRALCDDLQTMEQKCAATHRTRTL